MADPQLQIEQRLDQVEQKLEQFEKALETMADWLVQAQTGFGVQDAEGIREILRGDEDASE